MQIFQKNRMLNSCPAILTIYINLVLLVPLVRAYGDAEHEDIGDKARENYITYVAANPDTAVGSTALQDVKNWYNLNRGLTAEDYPPKNCLDHFWWVGPINWPTQNPEENNGLYGCKSAYTKANQRWAAALDAYKKGDYATAYENLGRTMHLAADMGVPAHVNNDPHAHMSPYDDSDWYESDYITTHHGTCTTLGAANDLKIIMLQTNLAARRFDSGPPNGGFCEGPDGSTSDFGEDGSVDCGTRRAGGFTDTKGIAIANTCYPAAIEADGAILRLFYDTVKPSVVLTSPWEGDIKSGIEGIDPIASAKAYGGDADLIGNVEFYYTTDDSYTPSSFESLNCIVVHYTKYEWRTRWYNAINDNKVWLRAIAMDKGKCNSLPNNTWIKIDSKRPDVTNTKSH